MKKSRKKKQGEKKSENCEKPRHRLVEFGRQLRENSFGVAWNV